MLIFSLRKLFKTVIFFISWEIHAQVALPTFQGVLFAGSVTTIEDFESGTWRWDPWAVISSDGSVSSSHAHDGSRGLTDPDWVYRTDVTFGNTAGKKLSVWARPSSNSGGRFYFGFSASASGTRKLVMAPNTTVFCFMDGGNYENYTIVSTTSQSYTANKWYKLEVEYLGNGEYTGRLYDSDGTTVLNTLTYDFGDEQSGGVALRSFGTMSIDTIELQ